MRKTTWNTSSTQKKKQRHPYKSAVLLMAMGLLLSGNMPAKAAVIQEDLANPVMDKESHLPWQGPEPHITEYKYVYFGNYPQRELKGAEITDVIKNASYDTYGDAVIDGKRYRRINYEMTTISGLWNERPDNFAKKATDGYRYFVYEPIRWKILQNKNGVLFLWSDLALDVQMMNNSSGADNHWENSKLRKWLNYDGTVQVPLGRYYKNPGFMDYAFTDAEQGRIRVTHLVQDSNPKYTLSDGSPILGGPDTDDRIFILNYTDVTNEDYGFCKTTLCCKCLQVKYADYGRVMGSSDDCDDREQNYGLYTYAFAWLRTPGERYGCSMWHDSEISELGSFDTQNTWAVVPALNAGYTLDDCIRVSFATGTDTKVEDQILLGSNYAREPVTTAVTGAETKLVLKKEGYEFTGWYLDEACTKPYSFNRKLTQDTTLYAGWKKCQAAPAGLKGGVMKIEGTTSAMEYAASKDGSGGWTDCQEGTTVVPSAGTWYVRYKETTECFAGEAAEVTVITAEEAVAAYIREHNIPQATAAITQETIENTSGEKDMEGSTFSILQAKTGKVTSKSIGLKWKAVEEADGYEIYGNKCGKKNKYRLITTVSGEKSISFTQKKLKKGTYYKYIVRAYKEVEGKKVSLAVSKTIHVTTTGGKYGNAKSVKIKTDKKLKKKKGTYTVELKKNKKYSLKASETKQNKKIQKHRATAYESGDTGIATVTAKGVIKGKQKGTCYIYVYAQNGIYQKIKVKVN